MILFDLKCGSDHKFEVWFKDSASYERQAAAKEIVCPICGDDAVAKALMAPNIATGENRDKAAADRLPMAAAIEKVHQAMRELRQHVEATHENVGRRFPEEVRKIHYGETKDRPIYGEASLAEARKLTEEKIAVFLLGPAHTDA